MLAGIRFSLFFVGMLKYPFLKIVFRLEYFFYIHLILSINLWFNEITHEYTNIANVKFPYNFRFFFNLI